MSGAPYTSALAKFAAGLTFAELPPDLVSHIKLCLLDTLGCGLFGSSLDWSVILRETLWQVDPAGTSPVWGTGYALSPLNAALANGAAAHAFELDDLHREAIVHLGSVVAPAAFAADGLPSLDSAGGPRSPLTGAGLLTALVAGYEVGARVGMSVGAAHLLQGWHPTGTHGTLAAAAAACSALGLDAAAAQHALGIAGSQSSGLMAAQFSSMVKRFHAGRAAGSGLLAALLAARGYTGITDLLESEYGGYWSTFSPSHEAEVITDGLGTRWETLRVGFKPYSTNGSCHTTIDLLLEMRESDGITAADLDSLVIHASSATAAHVGWRYVPDTVTTAQMNLPYIAAVVLSDGAALAEQFSETRIRDPELGALASRVTVTADPRIDARGSAGRHAVRVELRTKDGRVLHGERDSARGSAARPLSPAEIGDKFRQLAGTVLAPDRVARIAILVDHLDTLPAVTELTAALATQSNAASVPR